MRRDFHDPWEPEDVFERQEAADRRAQIEDAKVAQAAFEKHEAEQAAQRKESARLFTLKANRDQIMDEYRAAGVDPPLLHDDGSPLVSFSWLMLCGWTMKDAPEGRILVAPPAIPVHKRKSREDYDANS